VPKHVFDSSGMKEFKNSPSLKIVRKFKVKPESEKDWQQGFDLMAAAWAKQQVKE